MYYKDGRDEGRRETGVRDRAGARKSCLRELRNNGLLALALLACAS